MPASPFSLYAFDFSCRALVVFSREARPRSPNERGRHTGARARGGLPAGFARRRHLAPRRRRCRNAACAWSPRGRRAWYVPGAPTAREIRDAPRPLGACRAFALATKMSTYRVRATRKTSETRLPTRAPRRMFHAASYRRRTDHPPPPFSSAGARELRPRVPPLVHPPVVQLQEGCGV